MSQKMKKNKSKAPKAPDPAKERKETKERKAPKPKYKAPPWRKSWRRVKNGDWWNTVEIVYPHEQKIGCGVCGLFVICSAGCANHNPHMDTVCEEKPPKPVGFLEEPCSYMGVSFKYGAENNNNEDKRYIDSDLEYDEAVDAAERFLAQNPKAVTSWEQRSPKLDKESGKKMARQLALENSLREEVQRLGKKYYPQTHAVSKKEKKREKQKQKRKQKRKKEEKRKEEEEEKEEESEDNQKEEEEEEEEESDSNDNGTQMETDENVPDLATKSYHWWFDSVDGNTRIAQKAALWRHRVSQPAPWHTITRDMQNELWTSWLTYPRCIDIRCMGETPGQIGVPKNYSSECVRQSWMNVEEDIGYDNYCSRYFVKVQLEYVCPYCQTKGVCFVPREIDLNKHGYYSGSRSDDDELQYIDADKEAASDRGWRYRFDDGPPPPLVDSAKAHSSDFCLGCGFNPDRYDATFLDDNPSPRVNDAILKATALYNDWVGDYESVKVKGCDREKDVHADGFLWGRMKPGRKPWPENTAILLCDLTFDRAPYEETDIEVHTRARSVHHDITVWALRFGGTFTLSTNDNVGIVSVNDRKRNIAAPAFDGELGPDQCAPNEYEITTYTTAGLGATLTHNHRKTPQGVYPALPERRRLWMLDQRIGNPPAFLLVFDADAGILGAASAVDGTWYGKLFEGMPKRRSLSVYHAKKAMSHEKTWYRVKDEGLSMTGYTTRTSCAYRRVYAATPPLDPIWQRRLETFRRVEAEAGRACVDNKWNLSNEWEEMPKIIRDLKQNGRRELHAKEFGRRLVRAAREYCDDDAAARREVFEMLNVSYNDDDLHEDRFFSRPEARRSCHDLETGGAL